MVVVSRVEYGVSKSKDGSYVRAGQGRAGLEKKGCGEGEDCEEKEKISHGRAKVHVQPGAEMSVGRFEERVRPSTTTLKTQMDIQLIPTFLSNLHWESLGKPCFKMALSHSPRGESLPAQKRSPMVPAHE
ncbi:fatty acid reductase 4 [Striga asiatica]|uniref:Fatty acid reductase 4 n=1 Tax=Striga asiatica TaxID=4170 RepID=A0A5A7R3U1_STRAF|nr:fatty acid reductase 4 [Striga asiatica]